MNSLCIETLDSAIKAMEPGGTEELLPLEWVQLRALKELRELKKMKKQGLLLKLPCKIGDTVYEVQKIRHRIQPLEIISVYIGRMGELYFYWELKDGIGIYQNVKGFGISQLGKNVFLTRKKAEKKLEEMNGE